MAGYMKDINVQMLLTAGIVLAGLSAFFVPVIVCKVVMCSLGVIAGVSSVIHALEFTEYKSMQDIEWSIAFSVLSNGLIFSAWSI